MLPWSQLKKPRLIQSSALTLRVTRRLRAVNNRLTFLWSSPRFLAVTVIHGLTLVSPSRLLPNFRLNLVWRTQIDSIRLVVVGGPIRTRRSARLEMRATLSPPVLSC